MNRNSEQSAADAAEGSGPSIRQRIGDIPFVPCTPVAAVDLIVSIAVQGQGRHVHLANAYTIALADKSPEYRNLLQEPAINFPDGKPIGWISWLRRQQPKLEQVRGPQLFLDVFERGMEFQLRHYLLGSTPDVLRLLEGNLAARYPGVLIAGSESPPFRALTENEIRDQDSRIRESGAQIVWVGLGTPKQDLEALRLSESLLVTAIAVGAAFDFAAGTLRLAPKWMRSAGLEWAYRLVSEPRRLWKRYSFGNIRFLKASLFAPAR